MSRFSRKLSQLRQLGAVVLIPAGIILATVLVALLAPVIASEDIDATLGTPFAPPSSEHLLGTDGGSQDELKRVLLGARGSLLIGLVAGLVALGVGTTIGLLGGYGGRVTQTTCMFVTDLFLVIPTLPVMILIAALWDVTLLGIALLIGALSWMQTARLLMPAVASLADRTFVRRQRVLGASSASILFRHILPHVGPLIAAAVALSLGNAIFFEAALAFLGLGDPNSGSWGRMIYLAFNDGAVSNGAWWAIVPPGVAIAIVVASLSLVGRGIEDRLNPRLAVAHLGRPFRVVPGPQASVASGVPPVRMQEGS